MTPPPEVLDLFAVPDAAEPVAGGRTPSFRAGDLVLTPGGDPQVAEWLHPVLARLSVRLDEDPHRRPNDLRVALPVPARDGSWVVDGWGATRHEPGATACDDIDVTLAAGRVLHARLDVAVRERPPGLEPTPTEADRLGPDQLVHSELAGNVLLDAHGAPLVVGFRPAWAPVLWAEALVVLDSVVRFGADPALLGTWAHGRLRQALGSAVAHRVATDPEPQRYDAVLSEVASR